MAVLSTEALAPTSQYPSDYLHSKDSMPQFKVKSQAGEQLCWPRNIFEFLIGLGQKKIPPHAIFK